MLRYFLLIVLYYQYIKGHGALHRLYKPWKRRDTVMETTCSELLTILVMFLQSLARHPNSWRLQARNITRRSSFSGTATEDVSPLSSLETPLAWRNMYIEHLFVVTTTLSLWFLDTVTNLTTGPHNLFYVPNATELSLRPMWRSFETSIANMKKRRQGRKKTRRERKRHRQVGPLAPTSPNRPA
uniref:Uncharacterized protein n=1 Tax=Oryza punctata TaxID=4537 RepID=A0A0E0K1Q7_ORYPU